ncbi:F-box domain protein [Teratosphaeria destructans]|uniref:F-box domain protein n=1 Tax=Teratosphaeria destructans TaxID=418781 RepID=A0A9W7W5F5_9PEZI|nr:F-box domain protein [Teratosphaeria destructans]
MSLSSPSQAPTSLTDLPPELLDHITTYLPSAQSLASLGAASKSLHAYVEKDAWHTFIKTHFPSIAPDAPPSYRDATRTLATLSKAWDRRALVSRYIEPGGSIRTYPGGGKVDRWNRPRGQQTIGFTPHLDVYEEIGPRWQDRTEVFAFSAGAEVCVRQTQRRGSGNENVQWATYRPLSASEGRDDVTTLHLLKPRDGFGAAEGQKLVIGTANGDLRVVELPEGECQDVPTVYLTTQGLPVRSSSLISTRSSTLLAANMGDSRVCVYPIDDDAPKIAPLSSVDIRPPHVQGERVKHQRVWSTSFLSSQHIAAGIGPSEQPLHILSLTPSGLEKEAIRKFSLQNDLDHVDSFTKRSSSSVYPIVPLPASSASATEGNVFLSGAYDGIIRLHDLRSPREVEASYSDPTDDSAVYSLLPRGQETLVAGTSRHSLLKTFDLRLGAKCYSYLEASSTLPGNDTRVPRTRDWNLFLRPTSNTGGNWRGGRGRGRGALQNTWVSRRSHESSVYSLAASSHHSPYIYAGVENAVLELASTAALDQNPDSVFFAPWQARKSTQPRHDSMPAHFEDDARQAGSSASGFWNEREVLDLAMYDQTPDMKLCTQKSLWDTHRQATSPVSRTLEFPRVEGLDQRWRVGSG